MAPRAHDLMEEAEKVNQGEVHLTVWFLCHEFVSWKNNNLPLIERLQLT